MLSNQEADSSFSDDDPDFRLKSLYDERFHLSDGFQFVGEHESNNGNETWDSSVSTLRFSDQENLIVDDLLFCMQGIEGDHIRVRSTFSTIELIINPHFDASIRQLASRMISICVNYHEVIRYVESISKSETKGAVCQAFAAAARKILEEYNFYVIQLENCQTTEGLSLQKIWYQVQPFQHMLKILADTCRLVQQNNIRGGALLTQLHSKYDEYAGDTKSKEMFSFLLQAASKPYFDQVERWIYRGELMDKYDEFLVVLNLGEQARDASGIIFDDVEEWERRYSIREEMCPKFLWEVAEKILNTGKCLNVFSSCGRQIDFQSKSKLHCSPHDRQYLRIIEDAYSEAGRALVQLLMTDFGFIRQAESLKHYFMIDRGDWVVHFMEISEDELNKYVRDVKVSRIENLLAIAFSTSSVAQDALKDQIRFQFLRQSLASVSLEIVRIKGGLDFEETHREKKKNIENQHGFDAFALRYDAPWPLSIVFDKTAMFKYQLMFRQLFTFKHVERQLSRAWISKRRGNSQQAIFLHKLIAFVRKYLYHATVDVIEPNWHRFLDAIDHKRVPEVGRGYTFTLDHLVREHNLFLDGCARDLLLTEEPLILCVEKILDLCKETVKHFDSVVGEIDVEFMNQEYTATLEDLLTHMRSLSNNKRDKGCWMDVAASLGLLF